MAEWTNSLWQRLRARWHADRLDRDLQDETAFHLAMRTKQLQDAGDADAARHARHRLGDPVRLREDLRAQWSIAPRLGLVLQDVRYSARALRRKPGFALVVILTLAFGIGINAATFSIVNAVLIRPLGLPDADRLVALHEQLRGFGFEGGPFSPPDYLDVAAEQRSFTAVGAFANQPVELSGRGEPVRLDAARVSASLFPLLGISPVLGRTITPDEDRPGVDVAILSWRLWQTRFEGDRRIVGRAITLDRKPYTVVGVMPEDFEFPHRGTQWNDTPADVWLPLAFNDFQRQGRGNEFNYGVIGRLRPGVTLAAAQAELDVLGPRINARYPQIPGFAGFKIAFSSVPLREEISGQLQRPLLMLLAAVGLVLLVTCANVANLLLSRAAGRAREVALRTALGASRARLWQLLFAEALLLSSIGGVLGVVLSRLIVAAVPASVVETLPGVGRVPIDLRVLAFCTILTLLTSVIFALVPMLTMERRTPGSVLQEEAARTTPGVRRHRIQAALVVSTVALACVLLVGAGLFARSFLALMATDTGFNPDRVLAAALTLPPNGYDSAAKVRGFHTSLLAQVESLPGVSTATVATNLALDRYERRTFAPEGEPVPVQRSTNLTWVHGPYFATLGIRLTRGRAFTPTESVERRGVVIVNERLAASVWPGQDPVGKRLRWGLDVPRNPNPWLTVVGVVADVTNEPIGADPFQHAYEPFSQFPPQVWDIGRGLFGRRVEVAVRTDADPAAIAPAVRAAIRNLDPNLAIESLSTMHERVNDRVAPRRFSAATIGMFGVGALVLAGIGLYGLLAFSVAERQREIAVRLALGAQATTIVRMVAGQGVRLVAIGLIVGLAVAYVASSAVASFLYETHRHDATTFVGVPLVLLAVALLACTVPAYRASRVASIQALKGD